MRNLLIMLFLLPVLANAQLKLAVKYDNAKLIFADGTIKTGLVETSIGENSHEFVRFKTSKDAEVEKIENEKLTTVIYLNEDKQTDNLEYDLIKIYYGIKQNKISESGWFKVLVRGYCTLYEHPVQMQGQAGNPMTTVNFLDYYALRKGEPAGKVIANKDKKNRTLLKYGALYFEDYPELVAKIKSGEYNWNNLEDMVKDYNTWASKKK